MNKTYLCTTVCGNSSVGRARPCQGRGRGFESRFPLNLLISKEQSDAAMVELVDTRDLKSLGQKWLCGFESRSRHITLKMYTL